MNFSTLDQWFSYIASIHTQEIDLGLERVKKIAQKLDVLNPGCTIILVGGTNGKGSCVKALESIYSTDGYKVGTFTSPYLLRFNEQIRIQGVEAEDSEISAAFEEIERVRGDISLTPFEFHTLAALLILKKYALDLWVLEIGLGGRLDSVNIMDADISLITTIAIDHVEYLGDTREKIAFEKAGIFRSAKPAVCGDFDPPSSLIEYAQHLNTPLYCQGKEFVYTEGKTDWSWQGVNQYYENLALPSLALQNMASVLMVVELLQPKLPLSRYVIEEGLKKAMLPGRQQIIPGPVIHILDVSHNPASVASLKKRLDQLPCSGKTLAVFSMLGDKDILSTLDEIKNNIDEWYVASINHKRGASLLLLQKTFQQAEIQANYFQGLAEAYAAVLQKAKSGDRIVIFGSFHTIAEINDKVKKLAIY